MRVDLSGMLAMVQAALFDCFAFDPFSLQQDRFTTTEVDVGRRQIFQAFMVTAMIVVIDEFGDRPFQLTRHVVVLEQDAVLERLVPALDLALGHRMIGCSTNVFHIVFFHPLDQIAGNIA